MNQPTAFQAQYPLSKTKKFWKKMLGKLFNNIVFSFVLSLIGNSIFATVLSSTMSQSDLNGPISSDIIMKFVVADLSIFLIIFIVLTLIYAIYFKAYINRYYYDCGEDFVTIKKNVFTPTEIHVQYQKIQDVYVDQDIIDRIFGLYDVHIASATITSGIEAHIDGVNAGIAESLKNLILSKIKNGGNTVTNSQTMAQARESSVKFQSDKEVSSKTYPISKQWIYPATFNAIIFSLILALLFLGVVSKKHTVDPNLFFYAVILFAFFFFLSMWWKMVWKKNYHFEFTEDYILLKTGVLSRSEKHVPYKSIQNITESQGILDRMFGLSDVTIENATSGSMQNGISLVWQQKTNADELTGILNDIVSKINPQSSRSTGL
jgi:putative membrane protein